MAKSGDVGSLANYARDTLGTVDLRQVPPHATVQLTVWLHIFEAQALDEWKCCISEIQSASSHKGVGDAGRCLTQSCWRRINNAGSNAYKYKTLSESTDADLIRIVETNVLGTMLGCKEVQRRLCMFVSSCCVLQAMHVAVIAGLMQTKTLRIPADSPPADLREEVHLCNIL